MLEFSTESLIASLGYAGIFLLMIANGATSFPSSQALYIIAGYFISTNALMAIPVVIAGALGNTAGNILLYEVARAKGISYLRTLKIFPDEGISRAQQAFARKGAWFVFVGKLIPAIKVFVPIPAGLSGMKRTLYIPLILVSSALWSVPFLAIGFFFGKSSDVFGTYAIFLLAAALIATAIIYSQMKKEMALPANKHPAPDNESH